MANGSGYCYDNVKFLQDCIGRIMWQIKALIQKILAATPGGVLLNQKLQRLNKKSNSYSLELMKARIPALCESIKKIDRVRPIYGATIMEIGPGGSMISALLFYLLGAKKINTFDHINQIKFENLLGHEEFHVNFKDIKK